MQLGAHTPQELETLLKDAVLIRDRRALAALFENAAALDDGNGTRVPRGRRQIVNAAADIWVYEEPFLAAPRRVVQARGTALLAGDHSTSVARRSGDSVWRYTIALPHTQPQPQRSR
jgi:hypothetical protein